MTVFVVTRVPSAEWDPRRDVRQQVGWAEHAAFMDGLVDDGFVVLGGPLGPNGLTLLIVEAPDADAVRTRLADDPWEPAQVLVTSTVQEWTVWLGGRGLVSEPGSDGRGHSVGGAGRTP
jgi:uncharacterized protein YciI